MAPESFHPRYQLQACISEGTTGIVYHAYDRELDREVALKILRLPTPEQTFRLKAEFRLLVDLHHPNLVQLFDLTVRDEHCFFTMELVSGVDFLRWVRRATTRPEEQVRRAKDALSQLSSALLALHAVGKVHGNLKPSDILVTSHGRAVLVDMGLVGRFSLFEGEASAPSTMPGASEDMAPERTDASMTPSLDWYAVGALAYEALTGQSPVTPSGTDLTMSKRSKPTLALRQIAPDVPRALADVIEQCLQPEPSARPTGERILDCLRSLSPARPDASLPSGDRETPTLRDSQRLFIGRSSELQVLSNAFAAVRASAEPHIVFVEGASGMGKTALIRRFFERMEAEQEIIALRSRCHPREFIPFKAVDGWIDELSRYLGQLEKSEVADLSPPDTDALARTFSSIARIHPLPATESDASRTSFITMHRQTSDPDHELQRRAFNCLAELLRRLARRRPLALFIDDLQWGDLDSVRLLRVLLRPAHPVPALFVFSYRLDQQQAHPALSALLLATGRQEPARHRHIVDLGPLPPDDADRLANELLSEARVEPEGVTAISDESAGNPFFIRELARELILKNTASGQTQGTLSLRTPALSDLITARMRRLSARARELLEFICVAARPLPENFVMKIPLTDGDNSQALQSLRAEVMLRSIPVADGHALEAYHDQIREVVSASIEADRWQRIHAELGVALERISHPSAHELVEHFVDAGNASRAADYAYEAAKQAAECFAFEQAASLYTRALELGSKHEPAWSLKAKIGEAIVNAGRGADGARHLNEAADLLAHEQPENPGAVRLKCFAAGQLLRSGHAKEGLTAMHEALVRAGQPLFRNRIVSMVWGMLNFPRVLLGKRRSFAQLEQAHPTSIEPVDPVRLDALWWAGQGIAGFDMMRGPELQVRHALLAYRTRDPSHMARALGAEALIHALRATPPSIAQSLAQQADAERLAERSGDARAVAFVIMCRAFCSYFANRWSEAAAYAGRATDFCRRTRGDVAWELANAWIFHVASLVHLGQLNAARDLCAEILDEAADRDDRYTLSNFYVGHINFLCLADDKPDEARRRAVSALEEQPEGSFHVQHYLALMAICNADLYQGRAAEALERLLSAWPRLRTTYFLQMAQARTDMKHQRARCLLAVLAETSPRQPKWRRYFRDAKRTARSLRSEASAMSAPVAELVRASLCKLAGDEPGAQSRLASAVAGFDKLEMSLWSAAARYHLGLLRGGELGQDEHAKAVASMKDQGVVRVDRMAELLVPGLSNPSAAFNPPAANQRPLDK